MKETLDGPARPPPTGTSAPTGLGPLDRALAALDLHRVVWLHEPTLDPAPLLLHALHALPPGGAPAVYATTSRSPAAIEEEYAKLGYDGEDLRRRARLVDLREAANLQVAAGLLDQAITTGPAGVFLESLTGLIHAYGEAEVAQWFPRLAAPSSSRILHVQLSDRPHDPAARRSFTEGAHVVRVLRRDVAGVRHDSLLVTQPVPRWFPYRVERPGGVRLQFPKVLVTGPHNAGKSSLVHSLSETVLHVERQGTTVALDHGHLERNGIHIDVFGTPGQERFEPIIQQVAHGAVGVIVVLDSTRPATFHRARELAQATTQGLLPVVYAANKQDAGGAKGADAIRAEMKLTPDVPVLPLVATDRAQALCVLDALADLIVAWAPGDAHASPSSP